MTKIIYDQDYIKKCFNSWYLSGRPKTPVAIRRILPAHPSGRLPTNSTLNGWIIKGAWDMWADELDAKAYNLADEDLVNRKAQMLREHSENASKVAKKSLEYLMVEGFDSASSAVQAFFKAQEEQRKTEGFADLVERLDKMTNNQVEQEIIGLLNRASENDQVIDTVSTDIEENTEE